MPTLQLCHICLRTDFKLRILDGESLSYYEKLCLNSSDVTEYFCCSICERLLRKSYNFKNRCQRSSYIFQQWREKKNQDKPLLSELYKFLPPTSYGKYIVENCKEIYLTESGEFPEVTIKVEKYDPVDEVISNLNCKANTDERSKEYKIVDETNELAICDDHLDNTDVSDDDKCLSDYLRKSKRKVKGLKSKKRRPTSKKIKIERKDETKPKSPKQRRPLKDHKEYATVFDILLFPTEADARAEFARRKTSEPYVSAKYRCEVCYTVYKCEKLVNFHMRWHDPSAGEFPCDVCAMRFKSRTSRSKHKTDVHYGRFTCKRCPLITYHKMVMILHYRKHQGVSYICKICKRSYNHSSTYMSHLRKSHPTEHVCVMCAQTFVSEKGLTVHFKKVHGASSISDSGGTARCEPCDLTFANQQVYTVHIMNTHKHKDIADTLIACPECGIQLANKLEVRTHRRAEHPQYNFSAMKRAESGAALGHTCPLCGLSGTHNTWLYHHFLAAHPTECYEQRARGPRRTHLCDQCGKGFYNITQLREHAYLHAGLKPFRCERCPAAFRSKTLLKFHSERHAPPSRECPQCGKKFVSAANLSNHMRSHIGDRRYKCSLCPKGFLHSAALREHVRGVHLHIRRERKAHDK